MLEIRKSNRQDLVVIASETSGESFIFDGVAGEIGKCLGITKAGYLLADFENSGNGIEVIPPDKFGTISLDDEQMDESFGELFGGDAVALVVNPFGSWIADKAKGVMKRRTAKKALGRRLKAESSLSKARKAEADAIKAATKNPFDLFGKKKQFYVDFWGDGEFHQTIITARNKAAAIKIAGKGYGDFTVSEAQEVE
jgi:hypothetical protein